ncbi:hypothetical protein PTKIN_Ptkin11bG0153200 [Pterospermum kingtungense]
MNTAADNRFLNIGGKVPWKPEPKTQKMMEDPNPGVITIANVLFGSKGPINPDVLANAFNLDNNVVTSLQPLSW